MTIQKNLSVRELQASDIDLIASYWVESDPEFLVSMGVDLKKLPSAEDLRHMLLQQLALPVANKAAYALIWSVGGIPVGHCNVNKIVFGHEAYMHLHLWQPTFRQKGLGTAFVLQSLPFFFENLQLETLFCEPYALNAAPNSTLHKAGFSFVKKHTTIPGSINFEQEVNQWEMTKENYLKLPRNYVPVAGEDGTALSQRG